MPETVVILPDLHYPVVQQKAVNAAINFIGQIQPDSIIQIGDILDMPQPSRWTKDTRAEFEGSVYDDAEDCKRRFLAPLREVYDGPIGIHEGNHDERSRVYMERYAPALAKTDMFNFDKLLDFDGFGVDLLPEFYDIAPGWVTTHGHRGGIRLNQNAGMTALNGAIRLGKSLIHGHTHRAGICSRTHGLGGRAETLTGVEVGHMIDQTKAGYLKGGTGNWQLGFAVIEIDGKHVKPQLVPITHNRFVYQGEVFNVR